MPSSSTFLRQASAAALALLLAPASALCDFTVGDLRYEFQSGSDTEVYVSRLANFSATRITIPPTVQFDSQTYRVTSIWESAFDGCSNLKRVNIPDSVTSIGSYAFYGCSGLASVNIPDSVTSIGSYAFSGCAPALYETPIRGVRSVDGWAVGNQSPAGNLDLTGIRGIGGSAFAGCCDLKRVTIPDGVTSIGDSAFSGCSNLTSVTISDSVMSIGGSAFSGCASALYDTNSIPGVRLVDGWAVRHLSPSGGLDLTGIRGIGDCAFEFCRNLTSVIIPDSVTNIGASAFSWCSGLNAFSVASGNPAYQSVSGLLLTKDGKTLIYGVNGDVIIPDSVTRIRNSAFSGRSSLTSVAIPDSVTSIGNAAFHSCSGLTSVTIPDSVTNFGDDAFGDCSGLTNVTIGNSVTSIADYAFKNCTNLTSVFIPDSVTRIGWEAFCDCTGLTSVTISDSVMSIGGSAFSGCAPALYDTTSIPGVHLVDGWAVGNQAPSGDLDLTGIRGIGGDAFCDCIDLTSVTIPDNVMSIGSYAFWNCSGLTNVTIGSNVACIGSSAFDGCTGLPSVNIPDSVTSIGNSAFRDCSGLTSVNIPDSVTSIGNSAFRDCSGLTSVNIPDSVTSIGDEAFKDCRGLMSVTIPDSVVSFPTTAFDGCERLWTAWYRTLANLSASGGGASGGGGSSGGSGGSGKTVSLTVTNVVVHYVTQSVPSGAVTPSTNSTGIVNIIAEVTAPKAIAITEDWAKQYPGFEAAFGADFSAALTMETGKRDGAGNPMFVWQDFVAGTDPTAPASVFTASLTFDAETGAPLISWSPELSPAEAAKRKYTVSAKKRITDPDWIPIDGDAADYNFFCVTVEMR